MVARRRAKPVPRRRTAPAGKRSKLPGARKQGFVGRDPSPVLDHYPPKDPALAPQGRPPVATPPAPPAPAPPVGLPMLPAAPAPPGPPTSNALLTLERPFSVDEFAEQLGETTFRVTVPREELAEVLRRVSEFMGFGIYVYEFSVRPAPEELLKSFVVELRRVDFQPGRGDWVPFEEKGRSDSPFGPEGRR